MSSKSTRTRDEEDANAKDEPMTKLKKRETQRQSLERLPAAERMVFEDRIGLAEGGFAGDDVWRVLLGEGLLATWLSFSNVCRLNRSCRRLHDTAWRAIWTCGSAELGYECRYLGTDFKTAGEIHAHLLICSIQ